MDHSVGLLDRNPRATNFLSFAPPGFGRSGNTNSKKPAPVVVEQPTRPLLTLLGAIAGDEDGIAILVDEATKNVVRMKTGEKFSGWMLSSVGKRSATFQNGAPGRGARDPNSVSFSHHFAITVRDRIIP